MLHFLLIHWQLFSTIIGAILFIRFFYSLFAEVWEDMGHSEEDENWDP